MNRLCGAATVVDEVHGFKYFDERDLLGFVDGTENPDGRAARAADVGDEDPEFAGGSYVIVQKYVHDLTAWNALPVEAQETAIGRTKLTNVELPDDVKPANSHVALTTITEPDGTERQILRDNMPFGDCGPRRVRHLLHRLLQHADRHRDGCCTTCSSAIRRATTTGSSTSRRRSPAALFFVPYGRLPRRPPGSARRASGRGAAGRRARAEPGSSGIGGLNRSTYR